MIHFNDWINYTRQFAGKAITASINKVAVMGLLVLALVLASCKDEQTVMKSITGKAGEVVVVIDKTNWDGEVGSALREVLAKDYPMLPQKEPSFNLLYLPKNSLNDLFRSHRNIIVFDIDESVTEPQVRVARDQWAHPQMVLYISAPNSEAAAKLIQDKAELIFNSIDQIERDRIIRNAKRYEEYGIRQIVAEKFGGSPYFPNGYSIKKQTNDFIWISYETTFTTQGILIFTLPYDGQAFPSLQPLITEQDKVLKENVPGMFENSYMTTAPSVTPVMTSYKYMDEAFVEIRGLWEVANDFMGGPFVEHVFYAKEPNKLLVVEGFVYAPKFDKRNYLRQVEAILYSFQWAENFGNK